MKQTSNRTIDLLIVGAGIAGASAAYFAARAGRRPTIIDAGMARASSVPTALINPVRGYQGRLVKRGAEAARFTFSLIESLCANGHVIPHGRGLWRPAPDAAVRAAWAAQLPAGIAHRWHETVPTSLGLRGTWHAALELPDSGWVDTQAFLAALVAASGAEIITARVRRLHPERQAAELTNGTVLSANTLLWCGGAWGAAQLGCTATYRPGSLIVTKAPLCDLAVSHGLYVAPYAATSVIGPTSETSTSVYPPDEGPATAVEKLLDRAQIMFAASVEIDTTWRGVRLARVNLPSGVASLTALGSRGYLMAPLLASEHACRL